MDLTAFYAESARRHELAQQEFAQRRWEFQLSPDAAVWAETCEFVVEAAKPDGRRWADYNVLTSIVEAADNAGLLLSSQPGRFGSAFSSRDETEQTNGVGFGFYPANTTYLIIHASTSLLYADYVPTEGITTPTQVLHVLTSVITTFQTPTPFTRPT